VNARGVPAAQRAAVEAEIHQRLGPLVMKHEIAWS